MKLLLREFISHDTTAIEAFFPAPQRLLDQSARPMSRWVAKCDGQVVAFGDYAPEGEAEYWLRLAVHPAYQQRGIGATLYMHLLNTLLPSQPALLRAGGVTETGARFLAARGFVPEAALWVKHLARTGELTWSGRWFSTSAPRPDAVWF